VATFGATFLGVATADFRGVALRGIAFLEAACLGAAFFLTMSFFVGLVLMATFALAILRVGGFRATARFAFGRVAFGVVADRLAAGFGDARLPTARDAERLKPLVTALISELRLTGQKVDKALGKLRWQSNMASVLNQRKQQLCLKMDPILSHHETSEINKGKPLKRIVGCVTLHCGRKGL